MGIVDAWKRQAERSRNSALYGVHSLRGDTYKYLPKGAFKNVKKSVAGATAAYESGADIEGRSTVTRVAAGAIIAGPIGAVVGGLFKKDRARSYVTITFADGSVAIIDGPAKHESKLREFARKVNAAAQTSGSGGMVSSPRSAQTPLGDPRATPGPLWRAVDGGSSGPLSSSE